MKIIDKYGYPVERIKGKWFKNIIRMLIIGNIKQTIRFNLFGYVQHRLNLFEYMEHEIKYEATNDD